MIGLLLGALAVLGAGDPPDPPPAFPAFAPELVFSISDEADQADQQERWGLESRRSPLKGYAIIAISGGTALVLGGVATLIANNQCKGCTGKYTPVVLLSAGGVAWAAGAVLWLIAPPDGN